MPTDDFTTLRDMTVFCFVNTGEESIGSTIPLEGRSTLPRIIHYVSIPQDRLVPSLGDLFQEYLAR